MRLVFAAVLGVWQAASLADPFTGAPHGWLQLLSLAGLVGLLDRTTSFWRGAALGWAFGTAWLAATWWWLYISLHTYGGLASPLAVLAVLGLAAFLALYYAVVSGLFVRFGPAGIAQRAIVFAALWLLAELLRNSWFTGFPWGASGYAHVDGWANPMARWVGVYGLSALAAGVAAALAGLLLRAGGTPRRWAAAAALAAGAGGLALLPAPSGYMPSTTAPLSVALLQGNIPQDEKFQPGSGVPLALQWYGEQLRDTRAALTVAPETALPLLPRQLPDGYWSGLQRRFATGTQAALVGIPLGDAAEGYANAVVGFAPGGFTNYRYDKHHLVPFGEFIPPFFRWFTEMMNIPLGDFRRGAVGAPSFAFAGERLAPNICYEDLFGEELAARFTDPATAPTVFVNVSNIGWFGDTVAIDQHLHISRMRALEFARPMVRATNTGATAFIDHRGVVQQALPRLTRGVLLGEVRGQTGMTPFARWASAFGFWPLWLLGIGVPAAALLVQRRRGPSA